jgi:hypothetical protein
LAFRWVRARAERWRNKPNSDVGKWVEFVFVGTIALSVLVPAITIAYLAACG